MSGGSYGYIYCKIEEMADALSGRAQTPERIAFRSLLYKVAKAAHAVEWVDSADYGPGDENAAIRDCFTVEPPQ